MMEKDKLVSLVTKAQNGDAEALNSLFNAFYNDVYYFALKTVKDDQTACDVTQEAFVEIIKTLGNLKEPAAFVTWMKQITYHQCTRYFKKKKDVLVDEDEDGNTIFDDIKEDNAEFIPDEALDKDEFKKTIFSMLDELSEEQRAAVMMFYFDELSIKQIAEIQGVNENTVKSRLNYARKGIKKSVEDYEKKHNIKLHAIPFFPFLRWIFANESQQMPLAAAETVAEGVSVATGTTVTATAVTSATATATAVTATATAGLGAKIAALPLVTKIIAAAVAATIVVGGTTVVVLLNKDDTIPTKTGTSISTPADGDNDIHEYTGPTSTEFVLQGILPKGCVYKMYNGTVLNEGDLFPEECTRGDIVIYEDYYYGYECISKDGTSKIDIETINYNDNGLSKNDILGSWYPIVQDKTKENYGNIVDSINGKDILHLYYTFADCTNLKDSMFIRIPSKTKSMIGTFSNCISMTQTYGANELAIPEHVENISKIYYGCEHLDGVVWIHANPAHYKDALKGTRESFNLEGNSSLLKEIALTTGINNVVIHENNPSKLLPESFLFDYCEWVNYEGSTSPYTDTDGKTVKDSIQITFHPNGVERVAFYEPTETWITDTKPNIYVGVSRELQDGSTQVFASGYLNYSLSDNTNQVTLKVNDKFPYEQGAITNIVLDKTKHNITVSYKNPENGYTEMVVLPITEYFIK